MIAGVVCLTLVGSAIAAPLDVLSQFKTALGAERIDSHVDSVDELHHAVQKQWELIEKTSRDDPSSRHHFITCSSLENSDFLQSILAKNTDEANFRNILHSTVEDSSCFLFYGTSDEVTKFSRDGKSSIRMLHPIPAPLKVHRNSLYAMDLAVPKSKRSTESKSRMFKRMESSLHFDATDLRVEFGVGHASESKMDVSIENIRTKLMRKQSTGLDQLSEFKRSNKNNVWADMKSSVKSSFFDVANKDACSYTALTINERPTGLSIQGLEHITKKSSECFANLVATLALEPGVLQISVRPHDVVLNDVGKSIIQEKLASSNHHAYANAGLNGTGQIVGCGDTGVDDNHCFFQNSDGSSVERSNYRTPTADMSNRKIVQYINYANSGDVVGGHGSHVSGTILGFDESGTLSLHKGHASGAKLAFFDMSTNGNSIQYPTPLSRWVFKPVTDIGGHLHSNSWGSFLNDYSSDAQDIDDYHYKTDAFLALFAAGNDGAEGFYSIGDPAVAKNSVAVGASDSDVIGSLAYFSSLGSTFDNRFKPDIVAPGYYTYSTNAQTTASCGLKSMAGTSMATPATAGNAAIIRQFFEAPRFWASTCKDSYTMCHQFAPRGATVKAMLMHSGEAMSEYTADIGTVEGTTSLGTTPDFYQGFGRVALPNVLPLSGVTPANFDLFVDEVTMTSYQRRVYTVSVTSNTAPLKATLVWMDPPSSVISKKLLLHDLDLKIVQPGGSISYGNQYAGDEFNNVEQVFISSPSAGTYTVVVTAKNIMSISGYSNSNQQKASIVITSVGSITAVTSETVTADEANYPLGCSTGQSQVSLTLEDHGTNGWGSGNSYKIVRASDNTQIRTGTLNAPTDGNVILREVFCLADDTYNVQLVLTGSRTDEIGLSISACNVYLDASNTIDSFTVAGNSCGACSDRAIQFAISGSFYTVPYGWIDGAQYIIQGDNAVAISGTLQTGILDTRTYCLPDGTYNVTFDNIPASDDDFIDDNTYSGYFGIEEYAITFSCESTDDVDLHTYICNDYTYQCTRSIQRASITLSGGVCTLNYITDGDITVSGAAASLFGVRSLVWSSVAALFAFVAAHLF